jgi:hypothetical protein
MWVCQTWEFSLPNLRIQFEKSLLACSAVSARTELICTKDSKPVG